jgi:hypothetical protein
MSLESYTILVISMIYGVISSLMNNKKDHSTFLICTLIGLYPHYMVPFVLFIAFLDNYCNNNW